MKHYLFILCLFFSGIYSAVSAGGFTLFARDQFYQVQDQIDTTRSKSEHYTDFGISLTDIGGSGLSFHGDAMYSNALYNNEIKPDGITKASTRQPFELSTGYLDWENLEGTTSFKLGRQQFTNLAVEAFAFDGLDLSLHPGKTTEINLGGGLIVPTPIVIDGKTDKDLLSNPENSTLFFADFSNDAIPYTILNGAFAFEKDLQEKSALRIALGTKISPTDFFSFDGTGRFSTAVKGLDRLDARATFMPSKTLNLSAWFFSERDRIDSINYFSVLLHEQLNDVGARIDFYPEGGGCVQGGYHLTSVKNEGIDHFFLINAANRYLDGGITFGVGYHGMTLQPRGGFNFPFLSILQLKGSAEYNYIDETDDDGTYQLVSLCGGIKVLFPFGLTVYPRIEYITNRYYSQDVRLLITSSFMLHNYWRSR